MIYHLLTVAITVYVVFKIPLEYFWRGGEENDSCISSEVIIIVLAVVSRKPLRHKAGEVTTFQSSIGGPQRSPSPTLATQQAFSLQIYNLVIGVLSKIIPQSDPLKHS